VKRNILGIVEILQENNILIGEMTIAIYKKLIKVCRCKLNLIPKSTILPCQEETKRKVENQQIVKFGDKIREINYLGVWGLI
jgi:hypothetical protein